MATDPESWLDDRAALLERSIEQHYEAVVGPRSTLPGTREIGVRRRFGYLPLVYEKDPARKSS